MNVMRVTIVVVTVSVEILKALTFVHARMDLKATVFCVVVCELVSNTIPSVWFS